ncbi:MAG: hypothetical protein KC713_08690, partial [Candidatus Omnitrophica bacterium]|nr:hypothetical protein [Candidatus Omnitrophota bacterium]
MKTLRKITTLAVIVSFLLQTVLFPQTARAQSVVSMPLPGVMVPASAAYQPLHFKGMTVHPENPLQFDFLVDSGDATFSKEEKAEEVQKLARYYLSALTVPEKDLWVNLSPHEENRIIEEKFAQTEMGRDLLAQDYILKQLTASLIYPEDELGQKFWSRVYQKVYEQFGTTSVPVNTFHKVWIVPDQAVVFQKNNTAFVVEGHLKVMLERDYLALSQQNAEEGDPRAEGDLSSGSDHLSSESQIISQMTREIILPEIEHEVNHGKNFAPLRQIYQTMILAMWYKKQLKNSILNQVYADQSKVKGIDLSEPDSVDIIYARYMAAYKAGVYNYIKEDYDPNTQQLIPRQYFSGGFTTMENLEDQLWVSSQMSSLPLGSQKQFGDYMMTLQKGEKGLERFKIQMNQWPIKTRQNDVLMKRDQHEISENSVVLPEAITPDASMLTKEQQALKKVLDDFPGDADIMPEKLENFRNSDTRFGTFKITLGDKNYFLKIVKSEQQNTLIKKEIELLEKLNNSIYKDNFPRIVLSGELETGFQYFVPFQTGFSFFITEYYDNQYAILNAYEAVWGSKGFLIEAAKRLREFQEVTGHVYRDFKFEQLIIRRERIILTDFEGAIEPGTIPKGTSIVWTKQYSDKSWWEEANFQQDIKSFAMAAFHLVTNQNYHDRLDFSGFLLPEKVSPVLAQVILNGLKKGERVYANFEEVIADLQLMEDTKLTSTEAFNINPNKKANENIFTLKSDGMMRKTIIKDLPIDISTVNAVPGIFSDSINTRFSLSKTPFIPDLHEFERMLALQNGNYQFYNKLLMFEII